MKSLGWFKKKKSWFRCESLWLVWEKRLFGLGKKVLVKEVLVQEYLAFGKKVQERKLRLKKKKISGLGKEVFLVYEKVLFGLEKKILVQKEILIQKRKFQFMKRNVWFREERYNLRKKILISESFSFAKEITRKSSLILRKNLGQRKKVLKPSCQMLIDLRKKNCLRNDFMV